jgi:4-methoxybenzoate monooxygenase (O-demethylating)
MSATAELLAPPVLDIDPFSDGILENPYPFHHALREAGPVVYLKQYDIYAVGRHDEAQTVLTDYSRFIASAGTGMYNLRKEAGWRPRSPLLERDPPDHTRVRSAVMKTISPLVIRKWKAGFDKEAERIVERILDLREFDAVKEVAEAFVLKVFPDSIGVNMPSDNAIAIGDMNFNAIGPQNDRFKRSLERVEAILEWYQRSFQRESMLPGGFGEEMYKLGDAGELDPEMVPGLVRSFIRGGMDTTIAGVGFTLNQLARDPRQYAMMHAEPAKMRAAFEEAIRYESPAQTQFRTTEGEVELSGHRLEHDFKVAIFLGAANRDPRKWPNPESFDVTRQTAGIHLAFGFGDHICIGQMIARVEGESILAAIARRAKSIELSGRPSYRLINCLRTLGTLPLRVVPA